jgi:GDPmannose 4,6-dehydratase
MTRALITGVGGQDGYYLAERLLAEGYEVHGIVRSSDAEGLDARITAHTADLSEGDRLREIVLAVAPDEIYNLAAISSVGLSWKEPLLTARVNGLSVAALLDAALELTESGAAEPHFVQASSAEIFGQAEEVPQTEQTSVRPVSPYGASKAYAHHLVGVYRSRGLFASACILYNHESPRRPTAFVTRKITEGAARIARGLQDELVLGNLDSRRDWGWAPDFARALHLTATAGRPDDFIIATGVTHTVGDFVAAAFERAGVPDWERRVRVSSEFARPVDPSLQVGNAAHAREALGWEPTVSFAEIVGAMVDNDLALIDGGASRNGG